MVNPIVAQAAGRFLNRDRSVPPLNPLMFDPEGQAEAVRLAGLKTTVALERELRSASSRAERDERAFRASSRRRDILESALKYSREVDQLERRREILERTTSRSTNDGR